MRRDRADWLTLVAVAVLAAVTVAAPFLGIPPVVSVVCAALAVVIVVRSARSTRRTRVKK